jgi:hypothetical protein
MKELVNEGKREGIIKYKLYLQEQIRRHKVAKLKLLMKQAAEREAMEAAGAAHST